MDLNQTSFQVEGMTCSSCVRHINTALKHIDSVEEVQVSLQEKKVTVKHDPAKATVEKINAAISEEGYTSRKLS